MTKLVERNKAIPCKANETLTTYAYNQYGESIQAFAGERRLTTGSAQIKKIQVDLGTMRMRMTMITIMMMKMEMIGLKQV